MRVKWGHEELKKLDNTNQIKEYDLVILWSNIKYIHEPIVIHYLQPFIKCSRCSTKLP